MKNLFLVFAHLMATIAKLLRLGGARALVSENLLLKQQLLIIIRSRNRALMCPSNPLATSTQVQKPLPEAGCQLKSQVRVPGPIQDLFICPAG